MKPRIYAMPFAKVYLAYLAKAVRKGRSHAEVDQIIHWMTGYDGAGLDQVVALGVDMASFFANAPLLNPARRHITGLVCGVRVELVAEPLMQEIRYLDKLIDELARGKTMDKILRS
jgi:hypothetical protein